MSLKLGELLVRENLITSEQLRESLEFQRANGGRLGSILVRLGMISDEVITTVLSRKYGVPSINLDLFHIDAEVVRLISQDVALKYSVMPLSKMGATLTLAMADPTNVFAIDDIKFMTSLNVEPVIASETSIQMAIGKYYGGSNQIDIFDEAFAFEAEKAANKTGKNGHAKNGAGKNGAAAPGAKLHDADLDANLLEDFEFNREVSDDFEVVEQNEEIDLAALA